MGNSNKCEQRIEIKLCFAQSFDLQWSIAKLTVSGAGCWRGGGDHDLLGTLQAFQKAARVHAVTHLGVAEPGRDWRGLAGSWCAAGLALASEETRWVGSADRTASVSAEEAGGGTSADGGGGGCVCAVEEERVACVWGGEARKEGEAAESPLECC